MKIKDSHWMNRTGVDFEKNLDDYLGFIYCLTEQSTGKVYVGRKQIWYKRGGYWYEGDWRNYRGSSNVVQGIFSECGFDDWTFEIIGIFTSKSALRYGEAASIVLSGSYEDDDRGYNGRIDSCRGKIKWGEGDREQWERIKDYFSRRLEGK